MCPSPAGGFVSGSHAILCRVEMVLMLWMHGGLGLGTGVANRQRFIDHQVRENSTVDDGPVDTRSDYEKRKQNLYAVPAEFRQLQAEGKLEVKESRGVMSSAMLSGIPEGTLHTHTTAKFFEPSWKTPVP